LHDGPSSVVDPVSIRFPGLKNKKMKKVQEKSGGCADPY